MQQSGNPANGSYDLKFALFDATTNGTQFGLTVTNSPVAVSNGQFSVLLDFGPGAFNGEARWLEIGVRTNGAMDFVTLTPRQTITVLPYALYALTSPLAGTNGTGATGTITTTNLIIQGGGKSWNLTVDTNGVLAISDNPLLFLLPTLFKVVENFFVEKNASFGGDITTSGSIFASTNISAAGEISAKKFSGDGSGLTNLPSASAIPHMLVFTNSGIFVVPEGVTRVMVEVWGGGGGGGTGTSGTSGSSGGGSGYGREVCDVTPGSSYSVTVGLGGGSDADGGTSSFGSLIQATGGGAGRSDNFPSHHGLGGTSTAIVSRDGEASSNWRIGGVSGFGGRGGQLLQNNSVLPGVAPGGGGGGAWFESPGNPGAAGRVIVYY